MLKMEEDFNKNKLSEEKKINKKKLIVKFSKKYENSQIDKMNVVLVYKDIKLFKYMLLPKSIYRKYYLRLLTNFTEEVIPVKRKDKNEIKEMLRLIYED
jgi:hypothetical protein